MISVVALSAMVYLLASAGQPEGARPASPSTRAWILVVRPPRERPIGLVFGPPL